MKILKNENQENVEVCPRYSLKKWEEKVFGISYKEPKKSLSLTYDKRSPNIITKTNTK